MIGTLSPTFKPDHWTDAALLAKAYENIDLEEVVLEKFEKATEKARKIKEMMHLSESAKNQMSAASSLNVKAPTIDASVRELQSVTSQ